MQKAAFSRNDDIKNIRKDGKKQILKQVQNDRLASRSLPPKVVIGGEYDGKKRTAMAVKIKIKRITKTNYEVK